MEIADSHIHTRFSADGADDVEDMCRAAIEKDLSYLCFTDHIDNNPLDAGYNFFDFEKYSRAIEEAREKYGDKITILKGVEFSEPHIYPKEFEKVLRKDFDFILVGVHYLGQTYVGDMITAKDADKKEVFQEYYREVLKAVRLGGFDALAHFDLPKRYLKETCASDLVDEIIYWLVEQGIGIEINTSPLRRGLNVTAPDNDILRRYIEAGGDIITVGSDSHSRKDVAANFDYAFNLLKNNKGTKGYFKGRKYIQIR